MSNHSQYLWALRIRTSMLHPWITLREFRTLEEGVKVYRANCKGQKKNGLVKLIAK